MEKYEEYKGYYYKITQDNFAESPDDWSNTDIFLVYNHRQFEIVRYGFDPHSIYESDEYIKTNKYKNFKVNCPLLFCFSQDINLQQPIKPLP